MLNDRERLILSRALANQLVLDIENQQAEIETARMLRDFLFEIDAEEKAKPPRDAYREEWAGLE